MESYRQLLQSLAQSQGRFAVTTHLVKREGKIDAVDLEESVHLIARLESKDPAGLRILDLR